MNSVFMYRGTVMVMVRVNSVCQVLFHLSQHNTVYMQCITNKKNYLIKIIKRCNGD